MKVALFESYNNFEYEPAGIKYVNNALYFPVHNGGKIKYKWLKAEVNLLINIHLAKKYLNIK